MQVTEIWRFPVKSLQGERLREATIGPDGIVGDRGWALFDEETGAHLTARRVPELLQASARVIDGAGPGDEPEVRITLPDGSEAGPDPIARDAAISAWLGRQVRLERAGAGVQGRFQTQRDETETGEWFSWEGPEGSFHDSTRASLSLISESAFGDWDRRRFRINLVLDRPGDVDLVGRRVSIGDGGMAMDVLKRIERCVMTTRPQPALDDELGTGPAIERDLDVLRTINRDLDSCLGVGGLIATPGRITVGDDVARDRLEG